MAQQDCPVTNAGVTRYCSSGLQTVSVVAFVRVTVQLLPSEEWYSVLVTVVVVVVQTRL